MNLNLIIVALIVVALAALLLPSLRRPHLLICLYAVASPITWTTGDASANLSERFAVSDVVGCVFLCVMFLHLALKGGGIHVSATVVAAGVFLLCAGMGMFVTNSFSQTFAELAVLGFIMTIFFAGENAVQDERQLRTLLHVWVGASTFISLIGVWDQLHYVIGTPQIISRASNLVGATDAIATFRNHGQAGAYIMMVFFVALAYWSARGGFRHSKFWWPVAMTVMLLFLMLTLKRAAIIGTAIGVVCWTGYALLRHPRSVLIVGMSGLMVFAGVAFFLSSRNLSERFWFKFQSAIESTDIEKSSFIASNWGEAFASFEKNPVVGRGYGNTVVTADQHETHSTYLKMLGEGGLLGIIGYFVLMTTTLWYFRAAVMNSSPWGKFLANLAPLLVGAVVSWGYIYHLRKREFWITMLIIAVASRLATKTTVAPAHHASANARVVST